MATKSVTFTSKPADLRVLNKGDLTPLGLDDSVEFKKTEFWRGKPVEVDSSVASILLEHEAFKGQFEESASEEAPAKASTDKQTTPSSPAKK